MDTRSARRSSVLAAALAALAALFASASQAQVFLQGFDAVRDGPPAPYATRGFVTSPYYSAVRQALVNRYGGAIAFGSPSLPSGARTVTAEVLRDCDVFVVTGMTLTLSTEEVCLLEAFVAQGGAVLSFRNEWVPPLLLGTALGSFGGTGVGTVVDAVSPVIRGRFGNVASAVQMGLNSEYLPTGAGHPVLVDSKRSVLVTFGLETGHAGRAVIVGDEEIFLNGPTPFGASFRGTLANNQLLFANIVDYLLGAPGLDAEGSAALDACTDSDHDGSNDLDDCDDASPAVLPGADEVVDGLDNDCDGEVDEGLDEDHDGVPSLWDFCSETPEGSAVDRRGCEVECPEPEPCPEPEACPVDLDADADGSPASTDCDDSDPSRYPGAPELPGNERDEDCDGSLGACDPNAEWRNHGEFVACVTRVTRWLVYQNAITQALADQLVQAAATSEVGRRRK